MARPQFVRDALRAVLREPAFFLTEVAWRWAFGLVTWLLLAFSLRQMLSQIVITDAEYQMARRSELLLLAETLAVSIREVLPGLLRILILLTPCVSLVWIVVATIGRWSTVKALLEKFPAQDGAEIPASSAAAGQRLSSLTALNFLRVVFTLATTIAFIGSAILVGQFVGTPELIGVAVLAWMLLALLLGLAWSVVNWFLSLAPIFIVRDGLDALHALGESLGLFRRRSSHYVNIAIAYSVLRFLALVAVLLASTVPAAMISTGGWRLIFAVSAALALGYFAVADFLYIAKLASYVALANAGPDSQPAVWQPAPIPGMPATEVGPQPPLDRVPVGQNSAPLPDVSTETNDV